MENHLIELYKNVEGNEDTLMNKRELKKVLKTICETVNPSSSLYFLLAGVDLSESNLDKMVVKAFNEIDRDRSGTITFSEFANSNWTLSL